MKASSLAWLAVIACVLLSTLADTLSTQYWKKQSTSMLFATITIAPVVFLCFGYVGNRFGLSIASCLTNSLVVVGPIIVGLIFFSEWKTMNSRVYLGILMVVIGITTIVYYREVE